MARREKTEAIIQKFQLSDVFRIIIIGVLSFLAVLFVPAFVERPDASLSSPMFTVLLYVFLTGFLIAQSIDRNRRLALAISVELSRLRRLVHLVEHSDADDDYKKSFRRNVVVYMQAVARNDFRLFNRAHGKFRKVTHDVYEYQPNTDRDKQLWDEMLAVTRDGAYNRQQVSQFIHSEISPYTWVAAVLLLLINLWLMLTAREPGISSQLFIAGGIMGLILVLDILFKLDFLTKQQREAIQALYEYNAKDIDQGA